jgi:predicted Zn finger-like uncharacterized protein
LQVETKTKRHVDPFHERTKPGDKLGAEVHYRRNPRAKMKITCQSCQSKYNVADEKVQGKIVKIRCRKCGATIVVDGTVVTTGSASSAAPTAAASGKSGAHEAPTWHVNVADNDQRAMTLNQVIKEYGAGTIGPDTYLWTEGMEDWKPLKEIDAVVAALHEGGPPASTGAPSSVAADVPVLSVREPAVVAPSAPAETARSPVETSTAKVAQAATGRSGGLGEESTRAVQGTAAPRAEAKRAAVRREPRARDLFASTLDASEALGSSTNSHDTGIQTSAPLLSAGSLQLGDPGTSKLTGERNENSVLFSLAVLTQHGQERAPTGASIPASASEDSGLIDLRALAAKAESMRPGATADNGGLSAPLMASTPLIAPLGLGLAAPEPTQRSKLPGFIGMGAAFAVLLVLGILIGVKMAGGGGGNIAAAPATSSAAPLPSAEPTSTESRPTPEASAAASATAPEASAAVKPKVNAPPVVASHPAHPAAHPAPDNGGAPAAGAPAAATAGKKGGDCGCNGDLMCLMKCSTAH